MEFTVHDMEGTMPALGTADTLMNETVDERSAHELAKLIRKLRWIGENDEAEELLRRLCVARTSECILAGPGETD